MTRTVTEDQIVFAKKFLNNVTDASDWFEYKCGFNLPLVGDYIQGCQGYYHPHDWVDFVEQFKHYEHENKIRTPDTQISGLKTMIEDDKRFNGTRWFAASFIDDLSKHPICKAFVQGIDEGVGAVFKDSYTIEKIVHYDERTISKEEAELAIASGAVFGKMAKEDIDGLLEQLHNELRYAQPISFHTHASHLFFNPHKIMEDAPEEMRKKERFDLFENALFEKVKRYKNE